MVANAVASPQQSTRLRAGEDAVAEHAGLHRLAEQFDLGVGAEAAAPSARAARVAQVLELPQAARVERLEDLGVLSGEGTAGGDQSDVVVPVGATRRAAAALRRVDQDVDVVVPVAWVAAGDDRRQQPVPSRGHPLRQHRREGLHHDRADLIGEVIAEAGRRREPRIQHRAFRGDDVHAAKNRVVARNVAAGDHEQRDQNRGERDRQRRVDVAARLQCGAGEIARHPVTPDLDTQPDHHLRVVVERIVVDDRRGLVDAVGNLLDEATDEELGRVEDLLDGRAPEVDTVPAHQLVKLALADGAGADHRFDVVGDHRHPHVGHDQPPDVLTHTSPRVDLHRRDPQGLLPDVDGPGVVGARHVSADVGLVRGHHRPGDVLAGVEHGPGDLPVGRLVPTRERVVVQDHVALLDLAAKGVDALREAPGHLAGGPVGDEDLAVLQP